MSAYAQPEEKDFRSNKNVVVLSGVFSTYGSDPAFGWELSYYRYLNALSTVICRMPTPAQGSFFDKSPIDKATLYVPESSLESYKTTASWSGFGTIQSITSAGIENNATCHPATIEAIYDLSGKRLDGMKPGLNIVRMSDGTTHKIFR
ncbi:MAG: hypothetical protein ACI3YD_09175 [Alloprevotella sp.]